MKGNTKRLSNAAEVQEKSDLNEVVTCWLLKYRE